MTTDSTGMAIGYGQYYTDPYLMALMQKYATGTDSTSTAGTSTQDTTQKDSVPFTSKPKQEEGNKHFLLKTVVGVGAATLIAAACKGKGIKPSQIGQGYKELWHGLTNLKWVKKIFNPEKFTMNIGEGDKVWYTGLGKNNILKGENLVAEAKKVGIGTNVPEILNAEGVSIAEATLTHTNGRSIIIKDGKIVQYLGKSGKELTAPQSKQELDELFETYLKNGSADNLTLSKGKLIDTSEQGIKRIFEVKDGNWNISEIETNRFAADSEAIGALFDNETIKKLVEAKGNAEELAKAGAKRYEVSKQIGGVTVNFRNGKVASIIPEGNTTAVDVSSDTYRNWLNRTDSHKTELEQALKDIADGKFDGFEVHSWIK